MIIRDCTSNELHVVNPHTPVWRPCMPSELRAAGGPPVCLDVALGQAHGERFASMRLATFEPGDHAYVWDEATGAYWLSEVMPFADDEAIIPILDAAREAQDIARMNECDRALAGDLKARMDCAKAIAEAARQPMIAAGKLHTACSGDVIPCDRCARIRAARGDFGR